jgi:hypothetical protein
LVFLIILHISVCTYFHKKLRQGNQNIILTVVTCISLYRKHCLELPDKITVRVPSFVLLLIHSEMLLRSPQYHLHHKPMVDESNHSRKGEESEEEIDNGLESYSCAFYNTYLTLKQTDFYGSL